MKRIVMTGPRQSKVVDVPVPEITENELLVKVIYTGMCHSEWHSWSVAKAGDTFGHEPFGVVAEVGAKVSGFKTGDRVTGLGPGYAEYVVMKPEETIHVPGNVADEDASIEPHSCLLSALERVPVALGDKVAVVGAGYMGLGAISLLKLKGAGRVVAVDPRREALQNALAIGATEVYTPEELPQDYRLGWEQLDMFAFFSQRSGKPRDMFNTGLRTVVEFSGTQSGLRLAGDMVSAHGYLGIGGFHNDCDRTVDFKLWNVKAFLVNNLHERRTAYQVQMCQRAMDFISSGQWKFTGLCHHIYTMEQFDQANSDMETKANGFIKGLIRCSE